MRAFVCIICEHSSTTSFVPAAHAIIILTAHLCASVQPPHLFASGGRAPTSLYTTTIHTPVVAGEHSYLAISSATATSVRAVVHAQNARTHFAHAARFHVLMRRHATKSGRRTHACDGIFTDRTTTTGAAAAAAALVVSVSGVRANFVTPTRSCARKLAAGLEI